MRANVKKKHLLIKNVCMILETHEVHPALLARAVKDVPKNYKVVMLVVPDIPEEEKLPSMR